MNRNAILNAMEKKAKKIFDKSSEYKGDGKRGVMIVQIRDEKNPEQWDSSSRSFGTVFRYYQYEGELVVSNGTNFEALVYGKAAFCKRAGQNSGTNYYQVLGYESFWPGAIISKDTNCICAFAGLSGDDDIAIAKAGITCYESLKSAEENPDTGEGSEEEEENETKGKSDK